MFMLPFNLQLLLHSSTTLFYPTIFIVDKKKSARQWRAPDKKFIGVRNAGLIKVGLMGATFTLDVHIQWFEIGHPFWFTAMHSGCLQIFSVLHFAKFFAFPILASGLAEYFFQKL